MDYPNLRDEVALPLIKANGRQIVLSKPGSATGWTRKFNPVAGAWYWEDSEDNIVTTNPASPSLFTGYAIGTKLDYKLVAESLIQATDKALLIAGLPALNTGDIIQDESQKFTVVLVQVVKPGDTMLVQKVVVR